MIVGAQLAYPALFLGLAVVGGWNGAATGAVLVGIPLVASVLIGLTGALTVRVTRGGVVAGTVLVLWLGYLVAAWWSTAIRDRYQPDPTEELIARAFALANLLATGAAMYLTWRAWGIRRARRAAATVDPWGN